MSRQLFCKSGLLKKAVGFDRQSCAAHLGPEVWKLPAELDPKFKPAAEPQGDYMFVLTKAASGLKDAPLLWNLRIAATLLTTLGFVRASLDAGVFYRSRFSRLMCVKSLHVDDTGLWDWRSIEGADERSRKGLRSAEARKGQLSPFGQR
jgi:hypothetical protein